MTAGTAKFSVAAETTTKLMTSSDSAFRICETATGNACQPTVESMAAGAESPSTRNIATPASGSGIVAKYRAKLYTSVRRSCTTVCFKKSSDR